MPTRHALSRIVLIGAAAAAVPAAALELGPLLNAFGQRDWVIWNVFLAFLPLPFAALTWARQKAYALAAGVLWLLFFPNAPYVITDLVHVDDFPGTSLAANAFLISIAVVYSLLVGVASMMIVEARLAARFGSHLALRFSLAVIALSSLAIYIGRHLRWNSWDIFIRPNRIFYDLAAELTGQSDMLALSLMLGGAALGSGAYLLLRHLCRGRINSLAA